MAPKNAPPAGLSPWQMFVVKELMAIRGDLGGLKVKSSVWGLLGGLIPSIVVMIYFLLKN